MIEYASQIGRSAIGRSLTVAGDEPDTIAFRLTKSAGS
ncbi:hypothetical protein RISK_006603 [Rhodopirellula islandica]|uniref:Uncharacterized protein n=1 Tax=Rhodopirellula islandica TaxID=595434 RepID=A0A0J1B3W4_RHOIS|nr:hypothetical protein RISK_006603 [Rhodopirellula islandica]